MLESRTEPPKAQPHLSFQTPLGCRLKSQVSCPVWGLGSGDSLSSWPFLFRNYPFQPSSDLFCSPFTPQDLKGGCQQCPSALPRGLRSGPITRSNPATIPGNLARRSMAVWMDFLMRDSFLVLQERQKEARVSAPKWTADHVRGSQLLCLKPSAQLHITLPHPGC